MILGLSNQTFDWINMSQKDYSLLQFAGSIGWKSTSYKLQSQVNSSIVELLLSFAS